MSRQLRVAAIVGIIVLGIFGAVGWFVAAMGQQPKAEMGQGGGRIVPFQRFGPDEFGVVCYIAPAPPPAPQHISGLSCIKVK